MGVMESEMEKSREKVEQRGLQRHEEGAGYR